MNDRVWILLPAKAERAHVTAALEAGFHTFVTEGKGKGQAKDTVDVAGLARVRALRLDAEGIHDGDVLMAPRIDIRGPQDQSRALDLAGKQEAVLVNATDWRVIPYENLIAAYRRKGTRLIAIAKDVADARLLLETLETGVDVVLLPVQHARDAAHQLAGATGQENLAEAKITVVRPVGLGDRACLDTASLLLENEGVLTGSSSHGLFLVASEARESGYVASRPFRVNAGAVHAYVLLPGGRTKYLSELVAGDEVVVADPEGRTRNVVLGRVKLERRPFLLIEAEVKGGKRFTILLQNAETIRLITKNGTKSVVELAPGDLVLVRVDQGGRHFGMSVDETVAER